jgi:peptide/nickel transport system substrate-binding protein
MKPRLAVTGTAALAAVLAALFFVAVSAASAARSGAGIPLLRIGITGVTTSTLDPFHGGSTQALSAELLTVISPKDGKIHPWLATSVTQPGKAVYVYHLRHGVRFWDGNELTGEDVAASWNYLRYPGSQAAFFYTSVKSIKATGKYEVTVTLRHVDASWKWQVAGYAAPVFEKAFLEAHKGTFGQPGTLIMGTGPWIPVSFDPTSGIEFKANPNWWGGKVNIQHISLKFFADESSEALAFRSGAIDLVLGLNGAQAFHATSGAPITSVPSCFSAYLGMETKYPPWNDVHVRRAVAYALYRPDLIKADAAPARPYYTLDPPYLLRAVATNAQINALFKKLNLYPFSIAKAKAELAKSAYPNGFTAPFNTAAFGSYPQVTQVIAAQLAKIGINLQVNALPIGAWFGIIVGADRSKIGLQYVTAGCNSPDPNENPKFMLGSKNAVAGSFNITDWAPADVDVLLKESVATTNNAKRFAIYSKLLKRLSDDVPYVPLFLTDSNFAISSKFSWPTVNAIYYTRDWALEVKAK